VQRRINGIYAELGGFDLATAPVGTDGCGIPTVGVPLREMATAMAALADPARLGPKRGDAVLRIRKALAAEPFMMAGTGRFCTRINGALGGRVLIKTGAEGVYCGFVPELGVGIALKIWDGAGRAAEVAMAAILHDLGMLDAETYRDAISPPILNVVGLHVGDVRPAREWMAAP
jgi:L-asparaginase II